MTNKAMNISIIVPVLNEGPTLATTLAPLATTPYELIVVDGGSTDETPSLAQRYADKFITCRKGRGFQQHCGAVCATGEVLAFVHADTRLPPGFGELIWDAFDDPTVVLGAFRLRLWPTNPWLRLVAHVANLRSVLLKLPYGDQVLFMRRSIYFHVGGFQDLPIMEDVDLVRRVKKLGKLRIVSGHVVSSSRRWQQEGMLYTTLRNWFLITRYLGGTSPERLEKHYPVHSRFI